MFRFGNFGFGNYFSVSVRFRFGEKFLVRSYTISTTGDWSCIKLATSAISSSFQTVSTTARWVALNSSLLRRSTENAVVRYQSRNQGGTVVEYFVISTEFSI